MADDTSSSRFKPKDPPKKFSWTGNNGSRFRGNGGTANVTPGGRPLDASGFERPLSADQMSQITARYGGGTPGRVSYPTSATASTDTAPPNPNLAGTPAATPPPATGDYLGESFATEGAPVPLNANEGSGPVSTTPPTMLTGQAVPNSVTGEVPMHPDIAATVGKEKTPQQVAEEDKAFWMANGGSQATWNRMQTKAGVRPHIDARATPSKNNSQLAYPDFVSRWAKEKSAARDNLKQELQ